MAMLVVTHNNNGFNVTPIEDTIFGDQGALKRCADVLRKNRYIVSYEDGCILVTKSMSSLKAFAKIDEKNLEITGGLRTLVA